jgi:ribosomal protein S8
VVKDKKMEEKDKIKIESIMDLLGTKNLKVPSYQRPYKWSEKNIDDLLTDIENALDRQKELGVLGNSDFKYRIGTVLLHNNKEKDSVDIVDGQQRTITFSLLLHYLQHSLNQQSNTKFVDLNLENIYTKYNLCKNYAFIKDWFALKDDSFKKRVFEALSNLLEVVVVTVEEEAEAFQLFDSQNSRGKALYPHDLLKAYHLREMNNDHFEMQRAVENWEEMDKKEKNGTNRIRNLFEYYLYQIYNWAERSKSKAFTVNDIDTYKGVKQNSTYPYAERTKRSMPIFQLTEPFIAGKEFFEMVSYYLPLHNYLNKEVLRQFPEITTILKNYGGAGFEHCKNLFNCAVLCYYDRFKNLDKKAIIKLFTWAFMLRVDRMSLSYSSINNYAVGESNDTTNNIAMFYEITRARTHNQIANMSINIKRNDNKAKKESWQDLYEKIRELNNK